MKPNVIQIPVYHKMNTEPLIAYFDGLCEWYHGKRNPNGLACGGYIILPHLSFPAGQRGNEVYGYGDGLTNNVAEFNAAGTALNSIYPNWTGDVILRGDSQLVCYQFSGKWKCNAPLLIPLLARLKKAEKAFTSLKLEWIPREQNEAADMESRIAYKHYLKVHGDK